MTRLEWALFRIFLALCLAIGGWMFVVTVPRETAGFCAIPVVFMGLVAAGAWWRMRRRDHAGPWEAGGDFAAPSALPWESPATENAAPAPRGNWLDTFLFVIPTERRADLEAALAARPEPFRLLVEIVEHHVVPLEYPGLGAVTREPVDLAAASPTVIATRRLDALASRDVVREGGFREGAVTRSQAGAGFAVLAVAVVTQGGEAPEVPTSRSHLLVAVERVLPPEPQGTLVLLARWIPADPGRALTLALARAAFPELVELGDDG